MRPQPKPTARAARPGPRRHFTVGPDYLFLVVGERCWGKAPTEAQARQNAARAAGRPRLTDYDVYLATPDVRLDDLGDFVYPARASHVIHAKRVVAGKEQAPA